MAQVKIYPEALRFVADIINNDGSSDSLGKMNFKEIVAYGNGKGYSFTDKELLETLNAYFDNKLTLPYWLARRMGGLFIWKAWDDRA